MLEKLSSGMIGFYIAKHRIDYLLRVAYLNSKEPRLLEVVSSIIFFEKEGYKGEEIDEKLSAYKGHLAEFFDEAYRTYRELQDMLGCTPA